MNAQIQQLLAAGREYERAGDLARTWQAADQALEMAHHQQDHDAICGALALASVAHWRAGHLEDAFRLANEALTHADRIPAAARALNILGIWGVETGHLAQAEEYFRRMADLSRQIGFREGLLLALHN